MKTTDRDMWNEDDVRAIELDQLDERFRRYRLSVPDATQAMVGSLRRYGQMSPLVVCRLEQTLVLIDGFKRLTAARSLKGFSTLTVRWIAADERSAKAALYLLNCVGRQPQELEEAWIVQALVREDGLSQVAAAELLGHHKSWVCRRLALLEKLCDDAREELQLGLLTPSMARQLTRLPAGNQADALSASRRESLTSDELKGVVDLLLAAGTRQQTEFILEKPREAVRQAQAVTVPAWDARLSPTGNRISKQLAAVLDQLARMETWLHHRGRSELALCDRKILLDPFERLSRQTRSVAELTDEFLTDLR
ncbi:MAG: ParB N-terminal domain-containing protein [Fuerstiella sp.]